MLARLDACGARRRRADRRGAPRAGTRGLSPQASAISSPSLRPPRDAVGDEDRACASTTWRATRARIRAALEPVLAGWTRPASSAGSQDGPAGRRDTRSSMTCSRRPCSRGAPDTRRAGARAGAGGSTAASSARAPCRDSRARRARGHIGACPVGAVAAVRGAREGTRRGRGRPLCKGTRAGGERDSAARPRSRARAALAAHAARLAPAGATENVLRRALRESRVRTVAQLDSPVSDLAALPDGRVAAVVGRRWRAARRREHSREVVVAAAERRSELVVGEHVLTVRDGTLTARTPPGRRGGRFPARSGRHALRDRRTWTQPLRRRGASAGQPSSAATVGSRSTVPASGDREPRRVQPERAADRDGRLGRRRHRLERRRSAACARSTARPGRPSRPTTSGSAIFRDRSSSPQRRRRARLERPEAGSGLDLRCTATRCGARASAPTRIWC